MLSNCTPVNGFTPTTKKKCLMLSLGLDVEVGKENKNLLQEKLFSELIYLDQ